MYAAMFQGIKVVMQRIAWKGRPVVIAFDSDAGSKPEVRRAEYKLAEVLGAAGARVRVLRLGPRSDEPFLRGLWQPGGSVTGAGIQ